MATTLPSPPSTPPADTSFDTESLVEKLDTLLEQYLSLLDTYTSLRTQLSTSFSSGFFSLAHANRNAAAVLGAGRRFGEEGYDGRMKAARGVRIEMGGSTKRSTTKQDLSSKGGKDHRGEEETVEAEERRLDTEEEKKEQQHPDEDTATSFTVITLDSTSKDPLKWFTAFPPPPLRQTQSHFTAAITSAIPELLSTISQMSTLEERIWGVRADLGIMDEYGHPTPATVKVGAEDEAASEAKSTGFSSKKEDAKAEASSKVSEPVSLPSPSKRRSFVSRSKAAEPRSRVLKLE